MSKTYEFKKIDSIVGKKATFYYLIIDGKNRLELFYNKYGKRFELEFDSIQTYMQLISEGEFLPLSKFRQIKGNKFDCLYEIKKGKLRVYCIKIEPDFFLTFAGSKDDEKIDYDTLRAIAKDFLKSGVRPNMYNNNNNE